jgi:hypothetical protein
LARTIEPLLILASVLRTSEVFELLSAWSKGLMQDERSGPKLTNAVTIVSTGGARLRGQGWLSLLGLPGSSGGLAFGCHLLVKRELRVRAKDQMVLAKVAKQSMTQLRHCSRRSL